MLSVKDKKNKPRIYLHSIWVTFVVCKKENQSCNTVYIGHAYSLGQRDQCETLYGLLLTSHPFNVSQ